MYVSLCVCVCVVSLSVSLSLCVCVAPACALVYTRKATALSPLCVYYCCVSVHPLCYIIVLYSIRSLIACSS